MAQTSKQMRENMLPFPLISIRTRTTDIATITEPERVLHLLMIPGVINGNHGNGDVPTEITDRFSNISSVWLREFQCVSNIPFTYPRFAHILHRFHWDNSTVTPESTAAGLLAYPAMRVSIRLTICVHSETDVDQACEVLFQAIESLTCEWLSLNLSLMFSSGSVSVLDWTSVRTIKWPGTLRRLELRSPSDGVVLSTGDFVPVILSVERAAPFVDYLRVDVPFQSLIVSSNLNINQRPTRRSEFCVGIIGPLMTEDEIPEGMTNLISAGFANQNRIIVDFRASGLSAAEEEYLVNEIIWDAEEYGPLLVYSTLSIEVRVRSSLNAYCLASVVSESCPYIQHGTHPQIPNFRMYMTHDADTGTNRSVGTTYKNGWFRVLTTLDDDWANESPVPLRKYRPY